MDRWMDKKVLYGKIFESMGDSRVRKLAVKLGIDGVIRCW